MASSAASVHAVPGCATARYRAGRLSLHEQLEQCQKEGAAPLVSHQPMFPGARLT